MRLVLEDVGSPFRGCLMVSLRCLALILFLYGPPLAAQVERPPEPESLWVFDEMCAISRCSVPPRWLKATPFQYACSVGVRLQAASGATPPRCVSPYHSFGHPEDSAAKQFAEQQAGQIRACVSGLRDSESSCWRRLPTFDELHAATEALRRSVNSDISIVRESVESCSASSRSPTATGN